MTESQLPAGRIPDAERRITSATLAKPFDLDHLLQTLAQQLDRKGPGA